MSFYPNLRDKTAGKLISKFGQSATLRKTSKVYDVSSGSTSDTNVDTTMSILELPASAKGSFPQEWTEEQITSVTNLLLLSNKELNTAGVTPEANDKILWGGLAGQIVALSRVAPAGETVIYKVGVSVA